jgi:hypothetical protein
VSTDVGVEIEQHETVLSATENEVGLVVIGIVGDEAKDTPILLRIYA